MKAFIPLLLASLAVNAALGALLLRKPPGLTQPAAAATPAPRIATPAPTPGTSDPVAGPVAAASSVRAPLWTGIGPESYDEAIVRLRAAGCTPREIAAVLRAMINEWMMAQFQATGLQSQANSPYWKSTPNPTAGGRPRNEMLELSVKHLQLTRTYLLTPELFGADESELRGYRERFGALDPEKLRRLAVVESEQNEQGLRLSLTASSTKPGDDVYNQDMRKQQERMLKERETAIQAILTPEEYAQYEVRNGPVAMGLRFQLENFRPTEAEYLALYAIEKSRRNATDSTQLTPQQRRDANDTYQAAIKAALGPDRYGDYEAVQRAGGDLLPRLVARLNLPLKTVATVNTVRDDTNARAKAIRENPQLTPEQRSAQLNTLAAEAEADLSALFGTQRGVEAYKDIKGEWLRSLRSTP